MSSAPPHKWIFKTRFRRNGFGWRSQPAIARLKEAVKEILAVATTDLVLAAEGAVLLLERLSPSLTHVDGSSGSMGAAVKNAIEKLVPVIGDAPADAKTRDKWLQRLWQALIDDDTPYIEYLADHWGQLCSGKEKASLWADRLIDEVRVAYGPGEFSRSHFDGASACLSALLKAERYTELYELLDLKRMNLPFYQQFRVKAAIAQEMGVAAVELSNKRKARITPAPPAPIATAEDYRRFFIYLEINGSYLNFYKSAVKKFPAVASQQILDDLIASTPGAEGKWFAAAKELKNFELAASLAYASPCDPRTLTKAAEDFKAVNPQFATDAGLAAIHWLVKGYGLDIAPLDIDLAWYATLDAARICGRTEEVISATRSMLATKNKTSNVYKVLIGHLPSDPKVRR